MLHHSPLVLRMLVLAVVASCAWALTPQSAEAAPASLNRGQALYNKGLVKQAIGQLEQTVKSYPKNAEAYYWLGKSYKKQGGDANLDKAKKAFRKAIALDDKQAGALAELAELLSWQPSTRAEAVDFYKQSYNLKSTPSVEKQLALNLTWLGRYDNAMDYAPRVAERGDEDFTWLKTYAFLLAQTGQEEKALELYEGPLNAPDSNDPYIQQGYGISLLKTGNREKAAALYNELKTKVGETPSVEQLKMLSGLAYDLGDYEAALAYDSRLPASVLEQPETQLRLARSLRQLKRYPEAIDIYNKLYNERKLGTNGLVEYGDTLVDAEVPTASLPSPDYIETLYKQALKASDNPTPIALRLARYYSQQEQRFVDGINFYAYVLDKARTPQLEQEVADYLRSSTSKPEADVLGAFKQLLSRYPESSILLRGYADVQSWEKETRAASLTTYIQLLQQDPNTTVLNYAPPGTKSHLAQLEEVLSWHEPKMELFPVYERVLQLNPNSKWATWSKARAYWLEGSDYEQAVALYEGLYNQYPNDKQLVKEYVGALQSAPKANRDLALDKVEALHKANPGNTDIILAYANLLGYEGKHRRAEKAYNDVLEVEPNNREARQGKALVVLWSGQAFKAKDLLSDLNELNPEDTTTLLGLAQANQQIGRLDKAIEILKVLKAKGAETSFDALKDTPKQELPSGGLIQDIPRPNTSYGQANGYAPAPALSALPVVDFEAVDARLDSALPAPKLAYARLVEPSAPSKATLNAATQPQQPRVSVKRQAAASADLADLKAELDILDRSLETLKVLQERSEADMELLEKRIDVVEQITPDKMGENGAQTFRTAAYTTQPANVGNTSAYTSAYAAVVAGQGIPAEGSLFADTLTGDEQLNTTDNYAQALTVQDEFRNQGFFYRPETDFSSTLQALESDINVALRPRIDTGFLWSTQDGNDDTYSFNNWVAPNQISVALTPQVRVRGGYARRRFYQPDGNFLPRSTFGDQFSVGLTAQPLDRLTLTGDFALTQFSQSDTTNIDALARARYVFHDKVKGAVGYRRSPIAFSLQSWAGLEPNAGPLAGQLVGQVRENAVFTEWNFGPWYNVDWNLAYEFAWIDGENTADNTKNQVYSSLGYNWNYLDDHSARLSHEFLYFGFDEQATNGFYDKTGTLGLTPVSAMNPLVAAAPGTVLGGYFSPERFFLNAARLELRGSFWERHLEYRVGGSLGVQNYSSGLPLESDPTVLASGFDVQLVYNINDTYSVYGVTDFLNAGGLFNRWRFGGGLQVRPNIGAISPIFGGF